MVWELRLPDAWTKKMLEDAVAVSEAVVSYVCEYRDRARERGEDRPCFPKDVWIPPMDDPDIHDKTPFVGLEPWQEDVLERLVQKDYGIAAKNAGRLDFRKSRGLAFFDLEPPESFSLFVGDGSLSMAGEILSRQMAEAGMRRPVAFAMDGLGDRREPGILIIGPAGWTWRTTDEIAHDPARSMFQLLSSACGAAGAGKTFSELASDAERAEADARWMREFAEACREGQRP